MTKRVFFARKRTPDEQAAEDFIVEHNLRIYEERTLVYSTLDASWYIYDVLKHGWRKLHISEVHMDIQSITEDHVWDMPKSVTKDAMYNRVNNGKLRKLVIDTLAHEHAIDHIPQPVIE